MNNSPTTSATTDTMASTTPLPTNVYVSTHPCLEAKLSQLRAGSAPPREVKALVHEISLILGCEALASNLTSTYGPKGQTQLGLEYNNVETEPRTVSLVPILRSGLGMVEAIQSILPRPVPVHHLGLYREPLTLEPVEYYNNLPDPAKFLDAARDPDPTLLPPLPGLAIVLDPVIATGGTCVAAIQTLREWGAQHILVVSILAAREGLARAAAEWGEGTEIWVAGVDEDITGSGMLVPGLGDIGNRLFLTTG